MSGERSGPGFAVGPARLILGFAQGMVLLALHGAGEAHQWPATEPWLFVSLACVAFFVPITLFAAIGHLRFSTFVLWTFGATVAVGGFAIHSVLRDTSLHPDVPSFALLVTLTAGLFIAYHLVAAADADSRFIARYATYFDTAWKNGVQLVLSLAFLGVFWLLLYLGAALFDLIKIGALRMLIQQDWFAYPASATVFAAAVHLSDVRAGLINGARALALMLLSWLLPVMALLTIAFLLALPAVGLEPLWAAVSATALLLTAAVVLAILINAAYQDGGSELPAFVLRIGGRLAAMAMVPLVGIAAYSLWLRIDQHGLTPERVIGVACVAVAALYAAGYAIAAISPGRWMKPLEVTNVVAAFVMLGIMIAMLTPLADPARIAVDDQIARLQRGLIAPEKFDFKFLRFEAARYGREALERLRADKSSPRAQVIAEKADTALKAGTPYEQPPHELTAAEVFARIAVLPTGAKLPESFVAQDWTDTSVSPRPSPLTCVRQANPGQTCEAFVLDYSGDGQPDVLLSMWWRVYAFRQGPDGKWVEDGYIDSSQCPNVLPGLRLGHARPLKPLAGDIEIDGRRAQLIRPCA